MEDIHKDANNWPIDTVHPTYGKVTGMAMLSGESYRFMIKDGVVSKIPLSALQ